MPGMRACHLLTLGEGKMWSIWDMAGPPDFYSSAVTSAIPGKAKHVQITCMQCKHENTIRVAWLFARLKNK